jgi:hypothetical protein
VHALRNIHAALVANGLLVDTQPIATRPVVIANSVELGTLNMREWVKTVRAVDDRVSKTFAAGLYDLIDEHTLVITSTFDDGPDCLEITRSWQGTSIPMPLANRLANMRDEVKLKQQLRLRVLRRTTAAIAVSLGGCPAS